MIDSSRYQGYLRNQWSEEKPQCVYYCSFLTGQNILAGLSASASEIGLVFSIRARAWHRTHNALNSKNPYSYTMSRRHKGHTSRNSKVAATWYVKNAEILCLFYKA